MLAPEPYLTACLETLRDAILVCRAGHYTEDLSHEHAAALMNAVHNIPTLVLHWETCALDRLRADLAAYDQQWSAHPASHLSLTACFDRAVHT